MSTIQLSDTLSLNAISMNDAVRLKRLMHRIYPPAYKHLWEDDGQWYVEETFNSIQLKKELADLKSFYYFVNLEQETIGILRLIHDVNLVDVPTTFLMDWVTEQARQNESQLLWLEAMDTQEQALQFYKKRGYTISSDFRLTFELMHTHLRGMHKMYKLL